MKAFAVGDTLHGCANGPRRPWRRSWWACYPFRRGQTPIVTYYPGSGVLSLNDSGSNSDPNLYGLTVYVATASDLPTSGTVATLYDWSSGTASSPTGGNVMNWGSVSSGTTETDALPAGVYNLAQLPTGLSTLAFGYSYSESTPFGTQTYLYGPDDSPGAVVFSNFSGATWTQSSPSSGRCPRRTTGRARQRLVEHRRQLVSRARGQWLDQWR